MSFLRESRADITAASCRNFELASKQTRKHIPSPSNAIDTWLVCTLPSPSSAPFSITTRRLPTLYSNSIIHSSILGECSLLS